MPEHITTVFTLVTWQQIIFIVIHFLTKTQQLTGTLRSLKANHERKQTH